MFFFILIVFFIVFFFKQKTAYEMRISDWSSDVCSSDLSDRCDLDQRVARRPRYHPGTPRGGTIACSSRSRIWRPGLWACALRRSADSTSKRLVRSVSSTADLPGSIAKMSREHCPSGGRAPTARSVRSEEQTSELQSLMRISYD